MFVCFQFIILKDSWIDISLLYYIILYTILLSDTTHTICCHSKESNQLTYIVKPYKTKKGCACRQVPCVIYS